MKASTRTSSLTKGTKRTGRIVVALAVHDKALAAVLAKRLEAQPDAVALLCPSTRPTDLVPWLDENRADVLLLDEGWLHPLGAGAVASLRTRWPDQRVLIIGDRASAALAEQIVRHRLQGFLLASGAADVCVKAVRAVERGELWIPRALLVELLFEHVHAPGRGPLVETKLTRREKEVIGYVRRGFANKRIAASLAIREDTVKKHLLNAFTKLGVHRRSEIMTSAPRSDSLLAESSPD